MNPVWTQSDKIRIFELFREVEMIFWYNIEGVHFSSPHKIIKYVKNIVIHVKNKKYITRVVNCLDWQTLRTGGTYWQHH